MKSEKKETYPANIGWLNIAGGSSSQVGMQKSGRAL